MKQYPEMITIRSENLAIFNKDCNKALIAGFLPMGSIQVFSGWMYCAFIKTEKQK